MPAGGQTNNKTGASTSVGKRNAVRQSHVINSNSNSNGHSKDVGHKEQPSDNGDANMNKHQIEKSETVSKATGAATAQGVSKCFILILKPFALSIMYIKGVLENEHIINKIRDLFKVKLYAIRSETKQD